MYGIIYKITNKVNNKIYIGQTTKGFKKRYCGNIKFTKNRYLKADIEKYGIDAFEINEQLDIAETADELDEKERYYISLYSSNERNKGYNIMSGVSHSKYYTKKSKQQITINIDCKTVEYFKKMAEDSGIPYQTLINLCLADCAKNNREINISWT